MRIGLFGQFGSGNTGNDGSLEAMLQLLKRTCPSAQLICICSRPEIIVEKFRIDAVPVGQPASENAIIRLINKVLLEFPRRVTGFLGAVSLAQGIDLIIVPGTGILDDFNEDPFGWPFAVLRWSVAARLAGARFAFISIGAGPVTHPLSRFFVRKASMMAAYRSYRDQVSYDFMKSLNMDVANDIVSADIAFALPTAEDELRNTGDQRVGLGIMTYKGWKKQAADGAAIYDNYLDKMTELIDELLQDGRQVRLLIGDKGDLEAVDDLQRRISASNLGNVIFEPVASLNDLMQQIAKTDIVVASRYHNIVCSLSMGRPAISIGYARKNDALLNDTGLSEFCHHIESFDPKTLLAQIDNMFSRREELVKTVEDGVKLYRKRLAEQEEVLRVNLLQKSR
ncbi:polysaccharide pyruvyl transferase family protein (plasmid) [Ochrobactrum quorumnocens]|uniref:Polysaccharide pyruvyl transferase family protein n=1 Tax=Ochrobactrum quorumnocens TaxID=271865 RepID=A0A248UPT0_9HYPH|nr:polysaccharide pyruvyl transferase family protein [[Ochrobactrum] quorumnocens]ASV88401.1 polysaccharide pyruvyl transferase family protein [[Ochrobactrum] quorumnocens]